MPRRRFSRLHLPVPPWLSLVLWLLAVPLGLAMAVEGARDLLPAWRLRVQGVPGEAVVTGKSATRLHDRLGWDRQRTSYHVTYRIDLPAGPVEQRHEVGRALFERLSAGERVAVRVDPGPPVLSEIEDDRRLHGAIRMLLAGIIVAGTAAAVLLERWRRRRAA